MDIENTVRYDVEVTGDRHEHAGFREVIDDLNATIVAESEVSDSGENVDVEITFTPNNDIDDIKTADGVTIGELELILQAIEEDPLWLQSSADRSVDAKTTATLSLDKELPTPSN